MDDRHSRHGTGELHQLAPRAHTGLVERHRTRPCQPERIFKESGTATPVVGGKPHNFRGKHRVAAVVGRAVQPRQPEQADAHAHVRRHAFCCDARDAHGLLRGRVQEEDRSPSESLHLLHVLGWHDAVLGRQARTFLCDRAPAPPFGVHDGVGDSEAYRRGGLVRVWPHLLDGVGHASCRERRRLVGGVRSCPPPPKAVPQSASAERRVQAPPLRLQLTRASTVQARLRLFVQATLRNADSPLCVGSCAQQRSFLCLL
mmetsp:Transcript_57018/g.158779  ORF Transcript_57018/g.158779 Transcript_57018/m.158779 type:complete len:258 (-) Transcript_57018:24-797(-)